ncbi:MAG: hypothetical protein HOV67_07295, partial [Kribbellaceae bacterium]|nr:hypothetical protein [Kribbellaceae bacterium]
MSQADPHQPPPAVRPVRLLTLAIAEGVIVAALVIALIVVSIRHNGGTANASPATGRADPGPAMC